MNIYVHADLVLKNIADSCRGFVNIQNELMVKSLLLMEFFRGLLVHDFFSKSAMRGVYCHTVD